MDRGILFTGAMVRKILADEKSVTRRLLKPKAEPWTRLFQEEGCSPGDWKPGQDEEGGWWWLNNCHPQEPIGRCPYGAPGDRLWVRETWADVATTDPGMTCAPSLRYRATGDTAAKWRPSIFMPRWASRITLAVESVTAERLQDITEDEARAEGVEPIVGKIMVNGVVGDGFIGHPVLCFKALWDSINGKRAPWEKNPWVWRIAFSVVK